MPSTVRTMTPADYDAVLALWQRTPGLGLNESDTREAITAYLARNPGMSFVAEKAGKIVGAVLCGHDGRRGYLHHLAVDTAHQRQGIGRQLVNACLDRLSIDGIAKCNLFLFGSNEVGAAFWEKSGWSKRTDIVLVQKSLTGSPTTACNC